MEDTFRVRVDKVFGPLGGDAPSSVGVAPALWCLTDQEIIRREWNRNKQIPEEGECALESGPSVLQTDLETDLKELSDYEVEEEDEEEDEEAEEIDGAKKRRRNNSDGDTRIDEYLDVRSNIGRDCTLDYEEEEDEYDKVAVGTKQNDDRLYMRDVKYADYGVDEFSEYRGLPSSFKTAVKDPRANHSAAIVRLREDAEAAGEFDALQLSDCSMGQNLDAEDIQKGEVDVDNPKPILKKRENSMDTKSQKRVRFMVEPESSTHEDQQTSGTSDLTSQPLASDDKLKQQASDLSGYSAGVPDYLRNPSRYTRYTFDSSDEMEEESNRKAYASFFNELKKRNTDKLMEETPREMPKSVVFTPKKKPGNDLTATSDKKPKMRENLENKRCSVDIAAEDTQGSESSAMEEDEPVLAIANEVRSSQKSSRQYRTKTNIDVDDNVD